MRYQNRRYRRQDKQEQEGRGSKERGRDSVALWQVCKERRLREKEAGNEINKKDTKECGKEWTGTGKRGDTVRKKGTDMEARRCERKREEQERRGKERGS